MRYIPVVHRRLRRRNQDQHLGRYHYKDITVVMEVKFMKEHYQRHSRYLFPCVSNYYREPVVLVGAGANTFTTWKEGNTWTFLAAFSPSA